ncbi:TPA: hypothetical protein I0H78_RS08215 [Enterococcus faecium]|nr:hypothetical protein [Enterococcus hirae]
MTEIQRLICFLESGKRTEISMNDYILLQKKVNNWSEKRHRQLLAELSRSRAIPPHYNNRNGRIERILKLRTA